ncbi:MAG TPA: hypothetical protein VM261_34015 [Kofleriaceae bacterium]|nr:hypothetical protein [Kofleriaceae bacterium]
MKKLFVALLGVAALVLNPVGACSMFSDRAGVFEFGDAEVRAAVEGTWTITVPASGPGTAPIEYTIAIAQGTDPVAQRSAPRSLVATAAACSDRTLVRSASACGDSTTVPLDLQLVNAPPEPSGRGKLVIWGTSFGQGELRAFVGVHQVSASIDSSGTASRVRVLVDNDYRDGTMVRVGPLPPAAAPSPGT